jgi:hypothetical protein
MLNIYVQVNSLNNRRDEHPISPENWAVAVLEAFRQSGGNLMPLTNLAARYLHDLVIPSSLQCNAYWL